ncbi:hypothetical protein JCM16303_004639 [Sporobolomyces ruberrimus]
MPSFISQIATLSLLLSSTLFANASPIEKRAFSAVEGARIQSAAQLSMAAYGDPNSCASVIPGTTIISQFKAPLGQKGFIAKVPSLKTVVIQFTGTSSGQNVFTDTQFLSIPLNNAACGSDCRGFAGAVINYNDAKKTTNNFAAAFAALEPGYTLTITGHSLGGAVAAIAGIDLAGKATYLITFGEFRVGNPASAKYIDSKYGANTYRVVHAADSIPAVVPRGLFNQHHGRGFLLTGTTLSTLKECSGPEAFGCTGGNNLGDHLVYFTNTGNCGTSDPTRGITV